MLGLQPLGREPALPGTDGHQPRAWAVGAAEHLSPSPHSVFPEHEPLLPVFHQQEKLHWTNPASPDRCVHSHFHSFPSSAFCNRAVFLLLAALLPPALLSVATGLEGSMM